MLNWKLFLPIAACAVALLFAGGCYLFCLSGPMVETSHRSTLKSGLTLQLMSEWPVPVLCPWACVSRAGCHATLQCLTLGGNLAEHDSSKQKKAENRPLGRTQRLEKASALGGTGKLWMWLVTGHQVLVIIREGCRRTSCLKNFWCREQKMKQEWTETWLARGCTGLDVQPTIPAWCLVC